MQEKESLISLLRRMMELIWYEKAWDDYIWWQIHDRKIRDRINRLIKEISRLGAMNGIGEPERLKGDLSGFCSRRITQEHRLVYRIKNGRLEILACKGHYEDR